MATSEINAIRSTNPGVDDIVWRLPPLLATSKDDPGCGEMQAIGGVGPHDPAVSQDALTGSETSRGRRAGTP